MEPLAYTGISIQKLRKSYLAGYLLPHNWDGNSCNLQYQKSLLSEYNYLWYAIPVLKLLAESHPQVADKIVSAHFSPHIAYQQVTAQSAIYMTKHYAIDNTVSDRFYEATGSWLFPNTIAALAWTNDSMTSKKALDRFIIQARKIGIDPDYYDRQSRDVEDTKAELIFRLGSKDRLYEILSSHVFAKPEGAIVGWTNQALFSAQKIDQGIEDDTEIFIVSSNLISIGLFSIQKF